MFGVAEDIDLSGLIGRKLERISVGVDRFELGFDDDWSLNIECAWRLEGSTGLIAEGERGTLLEEVNQMTRIIGSVVRFAEPRPPDRVEIDLGEQGRLILMDDSDMLESFSIEPIGIIV